jgi:hypothetical protein
MVTARRWHAALVAALMAVGAPAQAEANAGIPMIVLLWPGFWIIFVPVVLLEGQVARRLFGLPWRDALSLSGRANLYSTLAGIPGAWLALLAVEFLVGSVASLTAQAGAKPWLNYLLMPFMAPWVVVWRDEDSWVVPAAAMWLCVAFFFVSVWLERRVLARRYPSLPRETVRRWSWEANILSYGTIELLLAGFLVWSVVT